MLSAALVAVIVTLAPEGTLAGAVYTPLRLIDPAPFFALLDKLARTEPRTLACMHGSAFRGDGGKLLRALGDALDR